MDVKEGIVGKLRVYEILLLLVLLLNISDALFFSGEFTTSKILSVLLIGVSLYAIIKKKKSAIIVNRIMLSLFILEVVFWRIFSAVVLKVYFLGGFIELYSLFWLVFYIYYLVYWFKSERVKKTFVN